MIGFLDEFEINNREPKKRFIVKRVNRKGYKWFIIDKLHQHVALYGNDSDAESVRDVVI